MGAKQDRERIKAIEKLLKEWSKFEKRRLSDYGRKNFDQSAVDVLSLIVWSLNKTLEDPRIVLNKPHDPFNVYGMIHKHESWYTKIIKEDKEWSKEADAD